MSKPLLPIILVTGFLGAGKTTFVRHLLRDAKERGLKVGVIINEWGVADVDSSILAQAGAEMLGELAGGCACCSSQDEMIYTLLELGQLPREEQPDCIVLELSGLADPLVTLDGLTVAALLPLVRVASMISLVDAPRLPELKREDGSVTPLLVRQVALADHVVVNKSDLAFRGANAEDKKRDAELAVRDLNQSGKVVFAKAGAIDLESVWSRVQNDGVALEAPNAGVAAHEHTQTLVIPMNKPVWREKLEAAFHSLDSDVWRVKGFVRISGENDLFLAQYVGLNGADLSIDRFEPRYLNAVPPCELVFIGPNLDRNQLFEAFTGAVPLL
jgi:G3E family GTPase